MTVAPSAAQLRAFVAVAEQLHFGGAAATLGVSQPAVSAAVSALESTLGVRLVERTTRSALLTPVGEEVARHARRVLAALDALVDAAEHAGQPHTGPLRLGVIPTVAPYLLPALLACLRRDFPRLRPDVLEDRTERLVAELGAGRLDVAVLALPAGVPDTVELPLYHEEFVLLVPAGHPLDGATGVSPRVLREMELLLLEEGHCLREQAIDVCRQVGARTDHPARAASLATVAQLVAADLGVTLLPASAVPVEQRRGLGVARFAAGPRGAGPRGAGPRGAVPPGRTVGLVHRATSPRGPEYAELADRFRAAVRRTRLPVDVAGQSVAREPVEQRR